MKPLIILIALTASIAAAQIIVGTNSFDVVFEATNLAPAVQSRIVDDINLCRQLWTNSEVYLDGNDFEPFIGDGYVIGRPYFNNMRVPRNIVTNSAGAWSLFVKKQLSDAYLKAFEFFDANSNIISAANAFVDTLCHSNIVCNTMQELSEYVLIPPNAEVILPGWFAEFCENAYSKPSAMAFGYMNIGPEPSPGVSSNLFMRLQCNFPNEYSVDQVPCIWHDGKWKINAWDYNKW
jgi:hypothetical protein